MDVKYEYFDSQDIKAGKDERVASVKEEETKVTPEPNVEALISANPTTNAPEEQPRWHILNEWTPCSRSCGKGR